MDGFRDACAAFIAGPHVGERLASHLRQPERVVEFATRERAGIGRDDGSRKLKYRYAIEIGSENLAVRFTRERRNRPDTVRRSYQVPFKFMSM